MLSISLISSSRSSSSQPFFYVSMDKWSARRSKRHGYVLEVSKFYYADLFDRYEKMAMPWPTRSRKKGFLKTEKTCRPS